MDRIITLDYGSGGKKTSALIENMILPAMKSSELSKLGDGAVLDGAEKLVFSSDSFVISPIFFPGGDIGKLSVCGTVNDISMCGGEPKFLSCSLIIEEGFDTLSLERIIDSMARAARDAGVEIVTGDTKVVERGRGDGLYINTSGIGFLKYPGLFPDRIKAGDRVIVSGTVGDHGTAVMLARSGMAESALKSDCTPLNRLAESVLEAGNGEIRVLRDPTRGGLATTLNEFAENLPLSIELDEQAVPVRRDVSAACDMLGLDPMYSANEGKMVCVVSPDRADSVLAAMRRTEEGANAAIIGTVTENYPGRVVMRTAPGGSRILQKLTGAQLPRIC